MAPALTWELSTAAGLAISATVLVYRYLTDPLRGIPGPSIFENPPWKSATLILRGNAPLDLVVWHKKYGPVIRIGSMVSIADADYYRIIYGTYRFPKAKIYADTRVHGPSLFDLLERSIHRKRKSVLSAFYGPAALKSAEQEIKQVGIHVLIRKLENFAQTNATVNLAHEFHLMTFDVIGKLALGRHFRTLETGDHPMFSWILRNQLHTLLQLATGPFARFLPDPWSVRAFQNFTLSAILERRKKDIHETDVMMLLIHGADEQGNCLTDDELVPEIIAQFVAGTDTTAITLSWTMYYLMNNSKIMKKLKEELQSAIPSLDLADVNYDTVQNLPYLDAVIKESLRIRPVAAIILPREVPVEGLNVHGHHLPEGTMVGIGSYVLHHSPEYFNNPNEFIPERWFTQDAEQLEKMKKAFVPFSFGVRRCLGMHLAMLELKVCLASLIRRFEFKYVSGADMTPFNRILLRPRDMRVDAKVHLASQ